MHKIVLFGGTTEGRLLTEFLSQNKVPAIVCVATEYGEKVLEYEPPVRRVCTCCRSYLS